MRVFFLLATVSLLTLPGCNPCFNVDCDAPDVNYINGLNFAFDSQSFPISDVDKAYVLRFSIGDLETPIDTLFIGQMLTDQKRSFQITNSSFSNAVDFTQFDYGIYNNSGEYAFLLSDIASEGYYPTDCCCCYRNRTKTFVMNGTHYDRSGSTEAMVLVK